jgi:hypothetical protein|eukprot:COSAG01_NODE_424_length_17253_cov_31.601900_19_plen_267_part_00
MGSYPAAYTSHTQKVPHTAPVQAGSSAQVQVLAACLPTPEPWRGAPAPRRVSLWNCVYQRRQQGACAPYEHNLAKYLFKHTDCEIFCGQDSIDPTAQHTVCPGPRHTATTAPSQKRVALWHKVQKRRVVGNAAPFERNVREYLRKHPEYELYDGSGQLSERNEQREVEKVLSAIVRSVARQNSRLPWQEGNSKSRKKSRDGCSIAAAHTYDQAAQELLLLNGKAWLAGGAQGRRARTIAACGAATVGYNSHIHGWRESTELLVAAR